MHAVRVGITHKLMLGLHFKAMTLISVSPESEHGLCRAPCRARACM